MDASSSGDVLLDPGSFRDPAGHVYERGGRIFRTVFERAAEDYEFLRSRDLLRRLADERWIVASEEVTSADLGERAAAARYVVEHPRLPFISYPYEWTFPLLQAAALFHVDFQLQALTHGVALSDASAYNVQFLGPRPIFMDVLSLRRYHEGEFWAGHRQFCEQFLNPLLLRATTGVPHNHWYRGSLEGIATNELLRVLPARKKLGWNTLTHVVLPSRLQARATARAAAATVKSRRLPRPAFEAMLKQLRRWIARLEPADTGRTEWSQYAETNTYAQGEEAAKRSFIAEFAAKTRPAMMLDLGCNTGEYTEAALNAGAGLVVGLDFDQSALEKAYVRAVSRGLNFLPLFLDAANPSPDQGWSGAERKALHRRAKADALIALALEHHLVIGRNIPLQRCVDWLVGFAPRGVIEFVHKSDPTVQRMLALREDVFPEYEEPAFAAALGRAARIVKSETVTATGRRLFWYDRT
jgi:ribosomal protein L11 methylase PrmA